MTLSDRDFFASQALYGIMLSSQFSWLVAGQEVIDNACDQSLRIADTMMKKIEERNKDGAT